MRYLILRVPGHEYHQDLCYCLVPLCEPVCRFVATEAQRFLSYMLRDRFHVTSILWEGLPALYWYETLPAAIVALADTDKSRLLEVVIGREGIPQRQKAGTVQEPRGVASPVATPRRGMRRVFPPASTSTR